jgi:hypothetical protein
MASQASTSYTLNDGAIVSWGKGLASDLKRRLSSGLEPGMNRYDNLVDRGAEMIQLHEDGETVSNLINSAEIDFLWPNYSRIFHFHD